LEITGLALSDNKENAVSFSKQYDDNLKGEAKLN